MTGDTRNTIDNRKIGMATSYPNMISTMTLESEAVGDNFRDRLKKLTYVECDIDIDDACNIYEAVHWARWAYEILCGAVVHWEYSKLFNQWSLRIKYWRSRSSSSCGSCGAHPPSIMSLKRNLRTYFSGFCSRERGRHRTYQTKLQRN